MQNGNESFVHEPVVVRKQVAIRARSDGVIRYGIRIRNRQDQSAARIRVEHELPPGARCVGAEPMPEERDGQVVWDLGELQPGEERPVRVKVRGGQISGTATFRVIYERTAPEPETPDEPLPDWDATAAAGSHILDELLAEMDRDDAATPGAAEARGSRIGDAEGDAYIVFSLAGGDYAVPASHVLEVGPRPPVTPVPNVPEWLRGVANVRGDIVSLVSLWAFLEMDANRTTAEDRMLVVRAGGDDLTTALLVDRIGGLRAVAPERVGQPAAPLGGQLEQYLRGVADHGGRPLVLLDLERLLRSEKLRLFDAV